MSDCLIPVDAVAMAINSPEPEPVAEVADEEGESLHESEAVSSFYVVACPVPI